MPENQNELFPNPALAEKYVETVRQHYRNGHANYSGNRTEEQQLIAEVTADEAREIIDGTMLGILSVGPAVTIEDLPLDYESEVERAGFTWDDFRGEFSRLLVGFGVITNRLQRDGYNVPSYADMNTSDRMKAASVLLSDFLQHNALRFGVDSVGIKSTKSKTVHTDDGGIEHQKIILDKDKARDDRDINTNMRNRHYATGVAAHPAAKISPAEYRDLRRAYPEMDKDQFDNDISFYKNIRAELESRE